MLRKLWARWLPLAQKIGNFQSRLLLTVFYFVIVTPFGLLVRLLSDPLRHNPGGGASTWVARETRDVDLPTARKQS